MSKWPHCPNGCGPLEHPLYSDSGGLECPDCGWTHDGPSEEQQKRLEKHRDAFRGDWCVITAGPSAGKTSTLRELSARGYDTLPEAARVVIDQHVSEGGDPDALRQQDDFHEIMEAADRRIEENLDTDTTTFLDRSLADNIAYRRHFGSEVPTALWDECENRYDYIFILEQLPFEGDYARNEDEEEAKEIHRQLHVTYRMLGYDPITIPLMTVHERADLIEEHL